MQGRDVGVLCPGVLRLPTFCSFSERVCCPWWELVTVQLRTDVFTRGLSVCLSFLSAAQMENNYLLHWRGKARVLEFLREPWHKGFGEGGRRPAQRKQFHFV